MKTSINLSEIRNEYKKAPRFSSENTHEAMIVKMYMTKRSFTIGVNYWTKEEIAKGERVINGQKQTLVAPIYEA